MPECKKVKFDRMAKIVINLNKNIFVLKAAVNFFTKKHKNQPKGFIAVIKIG